MPYIVYFEALLYTGCDHCYQHAALVHSPTKYHIFKYSKYRFKKVFIVSQKFEQFNHITDKKSKFTGNCRNQVTSISQTSKCCKKNELGVYISEEATKQFHVQTWHVPQEITALTSIEECPTQMTIDRQ